MTNTAMLGVEGERFPRLERGMEFESMDDRGGILRSGGPRVLHLHSRAE